MTQEGLEDQDVVDWAEGPERASLTSELRHRLEDGLQLLPKDLRAAVVLRDVQSLSTTEAAETLGITESALKARLHRGWGDCYGHFLVATGAAEVMADPVVEIWDIAPMAVILPEAGGRFTGLLGTPGIRNRSGLSSNGLLHDAVTAALTADPV